MREVHAFRLMTREQIERLLFAPGHGQTHLTKTSEVRERLKLLYHHGFLERIASPVGHGSWAWRPVYRLAQKGAQLIAAELGTTVGKLKYWGKGDDRDHRATDTSQLFLNHTLKVNDVRIAIAQAATRHGYQVEKWLDDTQLKSQEMKDYVTVAGGGGENQRVAIIPDAYFVLHLGDRRAHFFLELDQATMSNTRWETRVRAYLAYTRGKYQARYQTNSLRILTVTTTAERLANLRRTTVKAGGKDSFWFTTFDQATAETIFLAPIWLVADPEKSGEPLIS